MQNEYSWLSDKQLEARAMQEHELASGAKLNPYRLDANGHRWIELNNTGHFTHGMEWVKMCEELERRKCKRK